VIVAVPHFFVSRYFFTHIEKVKLFLSIKSRERERALSVILISKGSAMKVWEEKQIMRTIPIVLLSLVAAVGILEAGGDIAPHNDRQSDVAHFKKPVTLFEGSDFYVGVGISNPKLKNDFTKERFKARGYTLQAGYSYNDYIAIEGRYMHHIGDVKYTHGNDHRVNGGNDISDYPTDFSNIVLFLKPQYHVDDFSCYALFGYGEVKLTNLVNDGIDRAEDGFEWGAGLAYDLTEAVTVYADYVRMYDGKGFDHRAINRDIRADAFTIGVTYRF